jgi:hypothetical protein
VTSGTLVSGTVASLFADDAALFTVRATAFSVNWYAAFTGVVASPTSLSVTYKGRSISGNATQTVSVYNWTTSAWVAISTTTVGSSDVLIANIPVSGALSNFVGAGGQVRVRVNLSAFSFSLTSAGNLMSIAYQAP